MTAVTACPLPDGALLQRYASMEQGYTDCFTAEVGAAVPLEDFVFTFYTTALFRLERAILARLAGRPSTDEQVALMLRSQADEFAAWTVEQRAQDQLLMCDISGRTRSWFMVAASPGDTLAHTTLYFGSAVVPAVNRAADQAEPRAAFRWLLGFHKLYSHLLLRAAARRLRKPAG